MWNEWTDTGLGLAPVDFNANGGPYRKLPVVLSSINQAISDISQAYAAAKQPVYQTMPISYAPATTSTALAPAGQPVADVVGQGITATIAKTLGVSQGTALVILLGGIALLLLPPPGRRR